MGKRISYEELCQREEILNCDREAVKKEMSKLCNKNDKIVEKLEHIRRAKLKLIAEKMNSMIASLNVGEIKLITEMYDVWGWASFRPKGSRCNQELLFKLKDCVTYDDIMNDNTKPVFTNDDVIQHYCIELFKLDVGEKCLAAV